MDAAQAGSRARGWRFWLLAALCALVVLAGGLWVRLAFAPMALPGALQSRVEARIDAAMATGDIAIADMVLALPEGGGAVSLEFRDVTVDTAEGLGRAAFPILRLSIAPAPLLRGQVRVQRIVVAGAGLNLTRSADGQLDLDFGGAQSGGPQGLIQTLGRLDQMFASPAFSHLEEVLGEDVEIRLADGLTGRDLRLHSGQARLTRDAGTLRLQVEGQLAGSRDATMALTLQRDATRARTQVSLSFQTLAARDLAATTPAFAWIGQMRAPIDGALTAEVADDGSLGAVEGWLSIASGEVILPGQEPLVFTALRTQLAYDANTRRARFDQLVVDAPQLAFNGQGHVDIDASGQILTGQATLTDITTNPRGLFEAPVSIDGAALDLRLTLGDEPRLEIGQATLHHGDLRGTLRGYASTDASGLTLALDAHLTRADMAEVLGFWPATAIPNTRWWVVERLRAATAHGADFALRLSPDTDPLSELSFDFTGADILALPAAPPVLDASGYLNLQNQTLTVALDGGSIGDVAMAGSRMGIADVSRSSPMAQFDLALAGAVPDLMATLAGPPFAVLEASGYAPDDIGQGQFTATASLSTDLIERTSPPSFDELNITANAIVTGFTADALIADRTLTADRMDVALTPAQLSVSGRAALDRVPVSGQWSVQLAPSAPSGSLVQARATVDRLALARFGVELPEWLISGRGEVDATVRLRPDGPTLLSLTSDLDGIALAIPPLAWRLSAAGTGTLSADITLGDRPEVTQLTVNAAGLSLDGAVTFTDAGFLNRFTAGEFRLGRWLDIQGSLIGRGAQPPAIEISGGTLDFRTMPSLSGTGGSGSGDIGPLNITLNSLQITEGIALTGLRAALDGASMSGDFRGRVNGAVQINGQLVASRNGPTVRLRSDDGGAVMRAAGVFDNMHGGAFDLILAPRAEIGQYDGRLTITGPRLQDAPVMADLLNLISVVGLLEQLSGDGINLGTVDGLFRITPTAITLTQGTALGPAIGISMDGVYDVASERYEMQGVVSPLYIVNGLIGTLFARRNEGLFGFNYRLIGDSADTQVSVNPLSILTPGIFREIFRAPPPDFSEGPDVLEGNGG